MIKLGLLSKVFLKKGEVFWRFCRFFSQNLFKINTRRHSFFTAIFWHFHQLFTQFSIFRWCESFTYFSWIKMDFRILWRRTLLQKLGHLLLTKKKISTSMQIVLSNFKTLSKIKWYAVEWKQKWSAFIIWKFFETPTKSTIKFRVKLIKYLDYNININKLVGHDV